MYNYQMLKVDFPYIHEDTPGVCYRCGANKSNHFVTSLKTSKSSNKLVCDWAKELQLLKNRGMLSENLPNDCMLGALVVELDGQNLVNIVAHSGKTDFMQLQSWSKGKETTETKFFRRFSTQALIAKSIPTEMENIYDIYGKKFDPPGCIRSNCAAQKMLSALSIDLVKSGRTEVSTRSIRKDEISKARIKIPEGKIKNIKIYMSEIFFRFQGTESEPHRRNYKTGTLATSCVYCKYMLPLLLCDIVVTQELEKNDISKLEREYRENICTQILKLKKDKICPAEKQWQRKTLACKRARNSQN